MPKTIQQKRLLSHAVSPETLDKTLKKISARIKQEGDKTYVTVNRQLELLAELSKFDLGRYLLQNQGLNGYWTHYILTHPWFGRKTGKNNRGEPLTTIEMCFLNGLPIVLAMQQRFEIFLKENQQEVKNNATLACIPCGMMGELLCLNYKNIQDIHLIGIDYDAGALDDAKELAEQQDLLPFVKLIQQDAWHLQFQNTFDLLSSNGLNIYEPDYDKVTALYRKFYQALKPNGKLVTSFVTYPPHLTDQCEWDLSKVKEEDLILQKILFSDIIGAKWQCYRSSDETIGQLKSVGFEKLRLIYDDAKIFPTVVAQK